MWVIWDFLWNAVSQKILVTVWHNNKYVNFCRKTFKFWWGGGGYISTLSALCVTPKLIVLSFSGDNKLFLVYKLQRLCVSEKSLFKKLILDFVFSSEHHMVSFHDWHARNKSKAHFTLLLLQNDIIILWNFGSFISF